MNIWRKLGKSRPQKLTNPKVLYHSKNYNRQWLWTRWAEVDRWGKPTFIFDPSHSWVMNLWSERFGNPEDGVHPRGWEPSHTPPAFDFIGGSRSCPGPADHRAVFKHWSFLTAHIILRPLWPLCPGPWLSLCGAVFGFVGLWFGAETPSLNRNWRSESWRSNPRCLNTRLEAY